MRTLLILLALCLPAHAALAPDPANSRAVAIYHCGDLLLVYGAINGVDEKGVPGSMAFSFTDANADLKSVIAVLTNHRVPIRHFDTHPDCGVGT